MSEIALWMGGKDAALYIGYSRSWIEQRATYWKDTPEKDQPERGRIRYRVNVENGDRRYYRPDIDLLLK